ncbi:hypothetical protein K8R43_00625 [archaeon]|nr:hypothetical protein [archaeon]
MKKSLAIISLLLAVMFIGCVGGDSPQTDDGLEHELNGDVWCQEVAPVAFGGGTLTLRGIVDYNGEEMCHSSFVHPEGRTDTYSSRAEDKLCTAMFDEDGKLLQEMCVDKDGKIL